MTEQELAAIRARATSAPPYYGLYQSGDAIVGMKLNKASTVGLDDEPLTRPVVDLFVHARADVLALLAEVDRLNRQAETFAASASHWLELATAEREERARYREIVQAVMDGGWYERENRGRSQVYCIGCGVELWPEEFAHRDECVTRKARALLGDGEGEK